MRQNCIILYSVTSIFKCLTVSSTVHVQSIFKYMREVFQSILSAIAFRPLAECFVRVFIIENHAFFKRISFLYSIIKISAITFNRIGIRFSTEKSGKLKLHNQSWRSNWFNQFCVTVFFFPYASVVPRYVVRDAICWESQKHPAHCLRALHSHLLDRVRALDTRSIITKLRTHPFTYILELQPAIILKTKLGFQNCNDFWRNRLCSWLNKMMTWEKQWNTVFLS